MAFRNLPISPTGLVVLGVFDLAYCAREKDDSLFKVSFDKCLWGVDTVGPNSASASEALHYSH